MLRCHPCWRWLGQLTSLSALPDVSIFSLKEIQLQKDPGYRGSAFQQSGRMGAACSLCGAMDPAGTSGYPHRENPDLPCASVPVSPI